MKRSPYLKTIIVVSSLFASASLATEIPLKTFSINNVTIGITTLAEVQKTYGAAKVSRIKSEDGSDVRVCYTHSSQNGASYLLFESGPMGEFKKITGFRISMLRPIGNCVATKIDINTLETSNGIRLGQYLEDFRKTIPVEFKRSGSELIYQSVNQRAADYEAARRQATTPEDLKKEIEKLRAKWPDEKLNSFDVTTTLRAKFKAGQLIDFYAHKIESN